MFKKPTGTEQKQTRQIRRRENQTKPNKNKMVENPEVSITALNLHGVGTNPKAEMSRVNLKGEANCMPCIAVYKNLASNIKIQVDLKNERMNLKNLNKCNEFKE